MATGFRVMSRDEILTARPPEWLIEGVLPQEGFATLFGAPGSFKSFVLLDMACSVATGTPFLGRYPVCVAGDAVYVFAEGGRGFGDRLRAWEARAGASASRLFGVGQPVDMLNGYDVGRLAEAIQTAKVEPRFIGLDTLARCFGSGDENSTRDMGAFVRGCDELRQAFPASSLVVAHHTGWSANQRPRGARALEGAVDTMFETRRRDAGLDFTFGVRKQKDDEARPPVECRALKAADSLVVRAGIGAETETNEHLALRKLREAGPAGYTLAEWLSATALRRRTLQDIASRLQEKGFVSIEGRRWHT